MRLTVIITGASKGIGLATAKKFLSEGHVVYGIDILPSTIIHKRYCHLVADVRNATGLPGIASPNILINNAGVQNSGDDIAVNLQGVINCTEKYGMQHSIQSIVNLASVSAHNGAEFPEYCASKGGVLAYTVNTAKRVAKYGATCNSLSFGGVLTELNDPVVHDTNKWQQIMDLTPLKKWATPEECAEWIYFISTKNKSMTAQDIIIDNGETQNAKFIW